MAENEITQKIELAIQNGNLAAVSKFIGSNQSILQMMTWFGTWLHVACGAGKLEIVKYLLDKGVDINTNGGLSDASALEVAASAGHLEIVRYLVEQGAKLDVSSAERNPLLSAIYGGRTDVAKFLIDAGIDTKVKYKGTSGKIKDALSFARQYGRHEIVQALTEEGMATSAGGNYVNPHEEIVAYMGQHFGPVEALRLEETLPASGIRVNVIPAKLRSDPLVLFTTGMSDAAQKVPKGKEAFRFTELLIRLPAAWNLSKLDDMRNFWPIKWLKQIASYPHNNKTWLGGPLTIISNGDPPQPIAPNTKLSCMMIARETDEANAIVCRDGRRILLFSLFPLYTEEKDLEVAQGLPALFDHFESHKIPFVVNPKRINVAIR